MAGAAQSIGWILQVDDKISAVLDKISTKAVEVGKAIADSVKVDLTPAFEQVHTRFSDMGSEMQDGFAGTNQVLGDIRDTLTDMGGFMREFLSVETVETMIDMLRPLFAEVKDVIAQAKPVIQEAKEAVVAAGGVFGKGALARFNQWILNVGFTLKTLEVLVWRPIKWVIGLPFRMASGLLKTVFKLLRIGPVVVKGVTATITAATGGLLKILSIGLKATGIMLIVDLLSKGVGAVLGPFGKMISDIMSALQFALQPLFMRFRFLVLPFLQVMFPIFVDLIEYIWKEYIGPFVMVSIPVIQKFVQWLIKVGKTFFDDPSKGWETLKDDLLGFWNKDLKPIFLSFMDWVVDTVYPKMGEWVEQVWVWVKKKAPIWWHRWEIWVTSTLYPAMGEWVSEVWEWVKKKAPRWWYNWEQWVKNSLYPAMGVAIDKIWQMVKDGASSAATWIAEKTGLSSLVGGTALIGGHGGKFTKVEIRDLIKGSIVGSAAGRLKQRPNLAEAGKFQHGGLIEGTPEGQFAVVGEGGTTEGIIPFGQDIPREDAIRMMQAAAMAASMAGGGGAAAGGNQGATGVFAAMLEHLAIIAENTESSDWMNDPDFDASKRRGPWQT